MKVGLVGFGFAGQMHYQAYRIIPEASVVAVAESGPNARKVPTGVPVFEDMASMIREVDLDLIDICLPTHLHAPHVEVASRHGKHVICEKPLARTVEEAQKMIHWCERAGVELYPAHVLRFFPDYAAIKRAVVEGNIGEPKVAEARRLSTLPGWSVGNWLHSPAMSGGVILDLAVHEFDFLRWVLGEVDAVFCQAVHNRVRNEACVATLMFKSGAVALVEAGWVLPEGAPFTTSLEIAGTGGLLRCSSGESAPVVSLVPGGTNYEPVLTVEPYAAELAHFIRCIERREQPICSARDGLEAVAIALAAMKSAESGRAEKVMSA